MICHVYGLSILINILLLLLLLIIIFVFSFIIIYLLEFVSHVSLQVAHVMLADFKAPLLPADACSREGNKVLPYQREAVPWQEL